MHLPRKYAIFSRKSQKQAIFATCYCFANIRNDKTLWFSVCDILYMQNHKLQQHFVKRCNRFTNKLTPQTTKRHKAQFRIQQANNLFTICSTHTIVLLIRSHNILHIQRNIPFYSSQNTQHRVALGNEGKTLISVLNVTLQLSFKIYHRNGAITYVHVGQVLKIEHCVENIK